MHKSLKKHTLHLRDGDFDYLDAYYAGSSLAPSAVIRKIVSVYVDNLKAKEEVPDIEVNLNEQP